MIFVTWTKLCDQTKYENVSQVTHLTCVWVQVRQPTSAETCLWGKWLAAMLALYTGKGVASESNLREHISHTPPQSLNKAAHSGFETQRRHHQKSKTGVSVTPQMNMCPTKFLGGLSLHLNHLIGSRMTNYDWPFGTLLLGIFWSNLYTMDLETYPRTYCGHFWHMSLFDDSRAVRVFLRKWVVSENQSFLDEGAIITPLLI